METLAPSPAAPPHVVAGATPPPAWRVAAAVARVEGPRLLRSPLVLAGFALNLVMTFGGPWVSNLRIQSADAGFVFLLGAAGTLIASNLATLRGRRHGTEELFGATPAPPGARTGGHLLAVAWPTALAFLLLSVVLGAAIVLRDAFGRPDLPDLAVGPLMVAGAGVLGVLLARWAPSPVAGPVACVAIAALELFLTSPAMLDNGLRWTAFWQSAADIDIQPGRPSGWHAVYLVGLVAMASVGALLRHGWRRPLVVAGATAVAVVSVSVWAQAGTVDDEAWAARNRLLADPAASQVCEDRGPSRYCYYPGYAPLVDRWSAVVDGVLRRVPAGAWPGTIEVRQKFATQVYAPYDELHPVLPDLPRWDSPDPDDGRLRPGTGWTTDGTADLSFGLAVASRVVGLPVVAPAPSVVCDASGQARAVVALWLAARSTPDAAGALRRLARTPPAVGGTTVVVPAEAVQAAVGWGLEDVGYAVALLERPADEVEAALARRWAEVTDPATTSAGLVGGLGVSPAVVGRPTDDLSADVRVEGRCR